MSDNFLGEIRIVGFNFAPTGWAQCDGQLMSISQNTALFSLLGTQFGGDGRSTFALPNLQGSAPVDQGQGPGLSDYVMGQSGGESTHTLFSTEIPAHTHTPSGLASNGDQTTPGPTTTWAESKIGRQALPIYAASGSSAMSPSALSTAGSSLPHNNLPPYLTMNFIIALQGIFPARS